MDVTAQLLGPNTTLEALMDEVWRAFAQAGQPEQLELLDPAWPWAAQAWGRAPTPIVLDLVKAGRSVPYEHLSQSCWLELLTTAPESLPRHALRACLRQHRGALQMVAHVLGPEALEQLWLLEPGMCLEVAQNLADRPDRALEVVLTAPASHLCKALELARLSHASVPRLPAQALSRLMERLRALVAQRDPGYAECLELLLELLDATRPLRAFNTTR